MGTDVSYVKEKRDWKIGQGSKERKRETDNLVEARCE